MVEQSVAETSIVSESFEPGIEILTKTGKQALATVDAPTSAVRANETLLELPNAEPLPLPVNIVHLQLPVPHVEL